MTLRSILIAGSLTLGATTRLAAQKKPAFDFTIANIMRGPEVYGREPVDVRWTLDGKWVYFTWLEPGADWRLADATISREHRDGFDAGTRAEGEPEPIFADAARPSPDGKTRLVASGGTITIVDAATGTKHVVARSTVPKTNVTFSADGRDVLYTEGNNAFAISLDSSLVRQLTDIRAGGDSAAGVAAQAGAARGGGGGRGGGRGGAANSVSATAPTIRRARNALPSPHSSKRSFRSSATAPSRTASTAPRRGGRGGGGGRGGRGGGGQRRCTPISGSAQFR